jgi:hypothetical protein
VVATRAYVPVKIVSACSRASEPDANICPPTVARKLARSVECSCITLSRCDQQSSAFRIGALAQDAGKQIAVRGMGVALSSAHGFYAYRSKGQST